MPGSARPASRGVTAAWRSALARSSSGTWEAPMGPGSTAAGSTKACSAPATSWGSPTCDSGWTYPARPGPAPGQRASRSRARSDDPHARNGPGSVAPTPRAIRGRGPAPGPARRGVRKLARSGVTVHESKVASIQTGPRSNPADPGLPPASEETGRGRPRRSLGASGSKWDCQASERPTIRPKVLRYARTDVCKITRPLDTDWRRRAIWFVARISCKTPYTARVKLM